VKDEYVFQLFIMFVTLLGLFPFITCRKK